MLGRRQPRGLGVLAEDSRSSDLGQDRDPIAKLIDAQAGATRHDCTNRAEFSALLNPGQWLMNVASQSYDDRALLR